MSELLIRHARIVDGTGKPSYMGDILVRKGVIAEIGQSLTASVILDADGRYLAPGFIDAHCHDDLVCLRDPQRLEKITQGVTTVVVGNCSFSVYPCNTSSRVDLRLHFSGLLGETADGEVFEDFDAYSSALGGMALNVVSLTGHAALRYAMVGSERRETTPDEIQQMCLLLSEQLKQGSAGLSLGLVYPPSAYASRGELVELAKTVQAQGKLLAAHIRSYERGLMTAIQEFLDVLSRSGARGLLSHLQCAGRPQWGSAGPALRLLEEARARGIDVEFDMYPYTAGSSYLLQLLPVDALQDGLDALLDKMRDPLHGLRQWMEEGEDSKVAQIGWSAVQISGSSSFKDLEGQTLTEAAKSRGCSEFELLTALIEADRGQTSIVLHQLSEPDVREVFRHSLHMVGSDGLPRPGTKVHPRAFGTFPRVLGHLRRDEKWFSLEDAVRRMTSVPAKRFGLDGRGEIRVGAVADLVLFEEGVQDHATFQDPAHLSTGITHVWVTGEPVLADSKPTGKFPGRVLK